MYNIKMIGIDLDGTLLNKQNEISIENIEAIRHCIKKGIIVYLVTGRPYSFTKYIARQIADDMNIIASNGGICEIGKQCKEYVIGENQVHAIIDVLELSTAHAFFKGKYSYYSHNKYDKRFLYDHMNSLFDSDLNVTSHTSLSWEAMRTEVHDVTKVLVYDEDVEQFARLRKKIECIGNIEVTDYQPISFDITGEYVNKGNALLAVMQEEGIKKEEFMAFGDSHNDLSMFACAGVSIAMSNAENTIKEYCDETMDNVDFTGVAKGIHAYIG